MPIKFANSRYHFSHGSVKESPRYFHMGHIAKLERKHSPKLHNSIENLSEIDLNVFLVPKSWISEAVLFRI